MMPARTGDEGPPPAYEEVIYDLEEGELEHPDTGATVAAALPYEHNGGMPVGTTRREVLIEWLTDANNPYFARSYVNRIWSYFLGVGLIDPVDDIRASNPPSNPALLDRLTKDFIDSGFDVRQLMRTICQSRVYQHSVKSNEWNEDDKVNFSHALARRLPAEVLFDAVHQAAGSRPRLAGLRPGTRSIESPDSSVKAKDGFLDLFGRPPRESACECERSSGMSLGQALNLVNGPTVADAIADPTGAITELVHYEPDPTRIVGEIYLRFLSREPTDAEREAMVRTFDVTDPANRAALTPEADRQLDEAMRKWEEGLTIPEWHTLSITDLRSQSGAELNVDDDGVITVSGTNPDKDHYTLVGSTPQSKLTGLRLELLPIPDIPGGGPGRAENGNFVLQDLRVIAVPLGAPGSAGHRTLQHATASHSQGGYAVNGVIDNNPGSGWAIAPQFAQPHEAVFEFKEDVGEDTGNVLVLELSQQYGAMHTLGRFRVSVTTSPRPVRHHGLPEPVLAALRTAPDARTEEQHTTLYAHFMGTRPDLAAQIRLGAAQDVAWALANSSAFLFNR